MVGGDVYCKSDEIIMHYSVLYMPLNQCTCAFANWLIVADCIVIPVVALLVVHEHVYV